MGHESDGPGRTNVGREEDGVRRHERPLVGGRAGDSRLAELKRWAAPRDAGISMHSAVCVVNGQATDMMTRNTPVLMYDDRVPLWRAGAAGARGSRAATQGEAGCPGRPCGREDVRPVHRLPDEDGAELQEGRCGAVRPDQRDCRPGPGWVVLARVHPADRDDGCGDDRFWSAFAATSNAERLQAWRYSWRPRGWDGWEGGRSPPTRNARCLELYRAGPRSWRSSSTCASATRKTRRWTLACGTWPTHCATCTLAWTDGRRVRPRRTRAIRPHTALHTLCRRKTKLALLPGAFRAPPCSIGWPPWDTWTWATSIFESRTFVPSSLPGWIRHWGGLPGVSVGEGGGDGVVPRHAQPRGRNGPACVESERQGGHSSELPERGPPWQDKE